MKKELNFSAYCLIALNVIYNIINLFGSTFLVSYFMQVNSENIPNIALFYTITYLMMLIFFPLIMYLVKKTKRVGILRIGVFFKAAFILLISVLKEKIVKYVIIISIINGLAESFYWSAYNVLKNETIKTRQINRFQEVNSILCKIVNLVFPIVLGTAIEYTSFLKISLYIFSLAIVQLVFSFFIKDPEAAREKYKITTFTSKLKNETYKPLKLSYLVIFLSGVKTVISTLVTLVIIMTFNSNMSLGFLTSIFAIVGLIVTFVHFRIYRPEKSKWLYIVCGILPVLACVGMMISLNRLTIIIFNFVYTVCLITPDISIDNTKNTVIRRLSLHKYIAEHQAVSEIFINLGRAGVYFILFIMANFQNLLVFKIFLMISMFSIPVACFFTYKLDNKLYDLDKNLDVEVQTTDKNDVKN